MTMDHAEAHERLGDLALDPARLAALDRDPAPDAVELRDHLAGCADCRAELEVLLRADRAIRDAFLSIEPGPPAILRPPAALRERVLAAAAAAADDEGGLASRSVTVVAVPSSVPRARRVLSVILAAALVVAVGLGGLLTQRIAELDRAQAEIAGIGDAVATLDRILATEKHVAVALVTADGTPGGEIAWNRDEVVVLSTSLARPPEGRTYVCWLEEDGKRWSVGTMQFSGSIAYWAGPLEDWHASFDPGSRFGVSLSKPPGGETLPVLVAEF